MEWETEVNWQGKKGVVKQRSLTFGEANDITRKCTNAKAHEVDLVKICEMKVVKSIVSAPFDATIENIRQLDEADGDQLWIKLQRGGRLTKEEEGEVKAACFLPNSPAEPAPPSVVPLQGAV